ncbi:MAG: hypothetical protein MMC33_009448, partial [Icmadophila ericetorum]|nr:hypothetical protein [Icmadophila ericetorum]
MPEVQKQDDELSRSNASLHAPSSYSPSDSFFLPKNRSTGNLVPGAERPAERPRIRYSLDAGNPRDHETVTRSPLLQEHEHGLGVSGLRRIRQQPPSRNVTIPPTPEGSYTSPSRSSSMTLNMPSGHGFTPGGPSSPAFNFSEDLSRFPSESLHSFSFAHQSEDVLHSRQNVLKRSIDFMRDRLGWAAQNPGLVNAQAKVSGDAEIQSMMELLARANILGKDMDRGPHHQGMRGPLTGPADMEGGNVFERSFLPRSESPDQMEKATTTAGSSSQQDLTQSLSSLESQQSSQSDEGLLGKPTESATVHPGFKRTFTDTRPLSLQAKLLDALAKPYVAGDMTENQVLTPSVIPSLGKTNFNKPLTSAVHGHTNRWAPAAQAIFTTEAVAPWTILAANDLACLVFGVTKAEVRKLGILEVVREDRRGWLVEKLNAPGSEAIAKSRSPTVKGRLVTPNPTTSIAVGSGITAMLLSKPPARQAVNTRRAQTDDGSGSSYMKKKNPKSPNHPGNKSRGVLLCGDVIPILKRNGATGSASLWVKEKRGGLIWVLEEIVEDSAYLRLNGAGDVLSTSGATETIWGEKSLEGTDVRRLVPKTPVKAKGYTKMIDYETINKVENFTARNPEGYSIPISVTANQESRELTVSSFPHIAGILVLSAATLEISSSNSVFSRALFGQPEPDGLKITELLPKFDQILDLIRSEDEVSLVDGIVIPEHSFRRARALLALREGNAEAAAIFSRPTGLLAKHRDGSDIHVDVQMRVVKSETHMVDENVIEEASEDGSQPNDDSVTSEVVYALWITYSRHLHSVVHPSGITSPIISRPGSPPRQPSPGQSNFITPQNIHSDEGSILSPTSLLSQQIEEAASQPISSIPIKETTQPVVPIVKEVPKKKTIQDFIIVEEMGQGAYGQVKLARYKKITSRKVVLKYVTKKRILVDTWTRDRRLGTVPLEIHVLDYLRKDGLKHPHIVEMTDFFEDDINYYIEMVPHGVPGMDLFDYIEMRSTMEEAECRNIFLQVVAALHHLHTKALVVHRDIKDENIILDGENKVKLIDFGSAAYIKNGPFDVFVGTIDYAAPEVLQGKPYRGKEQDVWALGILLYTLVYKENPFYSVDEILDHDLRVPWIMSEGSIDLIRAMLNRDVEKRLTITQ